MTSPKPPPSADAHRARIRALLERHAPGTLAFIDLAKTKFPAARLTALEVTEPDGTTHRITAKTHTTTQETP